MKLELEHNGTWATKCKLNDKDFGIGVEEINIKIDTDGKPQIIIKGRLSDLKAILEDCDIKIKGDDDLSTK